MFYPRALPDRVTIGGTTIEMLERGAGRDLLYLHGGEGADPEAPWIAELARYFRVLVPAHPGFGLSDALDHAMTLDDLAYFYLDFMARYDLRDTLLAGSSIGGWLALEIATKDSSRIDRLVLDNPVGLRFAERTARDFFDIFHEPPSDWTRFFLAGSPEDERDWAAEPEDVALRAARNREAFTRFAWSPYLHNPQLRHRLHRADIPALVLWGEDDRVASRAYAQAFAAALPQGEFLSVPDAGHFLSVDRPDAFVRAILDFARPSAAAAA